MFSFLFALFLAVSAEDTVCQRLESDENLYKSVLLRSGDFSVKEEYLKKYGLCISEEGQTLVESRGVPVIEELDCSDPQSGEELFFRNGKLCARSVRFFPSKKVFSIEKKASAVSMPDNWKSIENGGNILFYSVSGSFAEGQNINGEILTKNDSGGFTDSIGKPVYPEFVFSGGKWEKVFPLRESFELTVKDGNFSIRIISESPLPYEKKELLEIIGIRAAEINVVTPAPCRYEISGKDLKGVQFPRLEMIPESSDHGIYRISLAYSGLEPKPQTVLETSSYRLGITASAGKLESQLTVFAKKLSKEDIVKIQSVISHEIPSFFVEKK